MKLTLAESTGGYTGGGHVRLDTVKDSPVLETQSEGPLFFAKLEAGTYKIHVSGDSRQFTKVAHVNSAGQKQLTFIWPGQPQAKQFHHGASDPPSKGFEKSQPGGAHHRLQRRKRPQ